MHIGYWWGSRSGCVVAALQMQSRGIIIMGSSDSILMHEALLEQTITTKINQKEWCDMSGFGQVIEPFPYCNNILPNLSPLSRR
jgi:hypothetical protein